MSVRWTRTIKVSRGRMPEALAWAKEAAGFVEKKYAHNKVSVWMDAFGDVGTIRWSIDFPDLATVEKTLSQSMQDQDYWKMIDKAAKSELFIDGSAHDTVAKEI